MSTMTFIYFIFYFFTIIYKILLQKIGIFFIINLKLKLNIIEIVNNTYQFNFHKKILENCGEKQGKILRKHKI